MKKTAYNLIVILGPTASGKTHVAARLACDIGSEIISADSRQVYRGMDLGTGKDISEFTVCGKSVRYHMIDIVDPDYEFNVFEYQKAAYDCFREITGKGITPLMVGGTGLYIEAVIEGYGMLAVPEDASLRERLGKKSMEELQRHLLSINPVVHNTTDLSDRKRLVRAIEIGEYTRSRKSSHASDRPNIRPLVIGIRCERDVLLRRIRERLKQRFDADMIDEVKNLHASGISWERLDSFGLEYRYISLYLREEMSFDEMFEKLNMKINRFSKRQMTWFRRMERRGTKINWIDGDDYESLKRLVRNPDS